jgi:predicted AAA+ superfamily ATPase
MLVEAYLIFKLEKYSPKPKEIVNSPKKIYAVDTGLVNTIALTSTGNRGRIIENLVFLELVRWKSLDPLLEMYYWKDYQNHEIDFIIKRGTNVIRLLQVTHVSSIDELDNRELKSLVKGSELLGCNDLYLITWDLEEKLKMAGKIINIIPLWKWLLVPPMARIPRI